MIRKTVSRAFGRALPPAIEALAPEAPPAAGPESAPPSALQEIQAVFRELHDALRRSVEKRLLAGPADSGLQVSAIAAGPAGQEFTVGSSTRRRRVRNPLNGFIWIFDVESGGLRPLSLIGFHPDAHGARRLVEKPMRRPRQAFRFSSIPWLVEQLLGEDVKAPGAGAAR